MADTHVIIKPDFQVNTVTLGSQYNPSVAGLADGGFVVVWGSPDAQDYSGRDRDGIRVQLFNAAGAKIGGEFVANTQTTGVQFAPTVTALGSGFAVAWQDNDGANAIKVQIFDASGHLVGAERTVNTTTAGKQTDATISALEDGGFFVTWVHPLGTGLGNAAMGQRFDAAGEKVGTEVTFGATVGHDRADPSVSGLEDGGYVVTWTDLTEKAIRAQVFDVTGTALGAEFIVNTAVMRAQKEPEVRALSTGGFVIAWTEANEIHAQRFDAAGARVGAEILVGPPTGYGQSDPAIAATDDGGFIITWTKVYRVQNEDGVYSSYTSSAIRHYDVSGTVFDSGLPYEGTGGTFYQLNDGAIAPLADGGYVVVRTNLPFLYNEGFEDTKGSSVRAYVVAALGTDGPSEGNDSLSGTAGNDAIDGLGGMDIITGLAGDDSLDGGAGSDNLSGGSGNDTLNGGDDPDVLNGGDGADILDGNAGTDTLSGEAGNDTLYGDEGYDSMAGGEGDDVLRGVGGKLQGGAGSDALYTTPGRGGSSYGGDGDDYIQGGASSIWGGEGNDTIVAYAGGFDFVYGEGGDDVISTDIARLTVNLGAGRDVLSVRPEFPLSSGGSLAVEDFNTAEDILNLGALIAGMTNYDGSGPFSTGHLTWVTQGSDAFLYADMDGRGGTFGYKAVVWLKNIGLSNARVSYNLATADGDARIGTAGNDSLDGLGGDDWLRGLAGDDTLAGGEGNDSLDGGEDSDGLDGGAGDDALLGRRGMDTLVGGDGLDTLDGGDGDDIVSGGDGNDSIAGGEGHDSLLGGAGDDTLEGGTGSNTVRGGEGNDWIDGNDGVNSVLDGGDGNDALLSGDSSDSLTGGAGNDILLGRGGNDILQGGTGIDRLEGEEGNDVLQVDDAFQAGEIYDGGNGSDTLGGYGDLSAATISGIEQIDMRAGGYDLKATVQQLNAVTTFTYGGVPGAGGDGSTISLSNIGAVDFSGRIGSAITVRASNLSNGNQIIATQWNDTLIGGAGSDRLTGGAGDDRYIVGVGAGRSDTIVSGSTGADNDVLEITGVTMAEVRMVRMGDDLYIRYGAAADSVRLIQHFANDGTAQVKTLEIGGVSYDLSHGLTFGGTSAADSLRGGEFNDTITGHGDADTLIGLGGDDVLKGGVGNDWLEGGAGNDRYQFAIGDGQDTVQTPAAGDADVIEFTTRTLVIEGVRFERSGDDLVIGVGPGTDSIRLVNHYGAEGKVAAIIVGGVTYSLSASLAIDGTAGADTLTGLIMDDTLSGLAGADSLSGGLGNDSLLGGERWDTLRGGEGDDTLDGGLDNDQMYGGKGNDTYYVDNTGDRTYELVGEGNDSVISTINWSLSADLDNLTLTGAATTGAGNGLSNRIVGNALANTLSGGASADTLDGAAGADSLDGGIGDDYLLGGARWDTLIGGDGNDRLDGGADNDQMFGGLGDDYYYVDYAGDRVNENTAVNEGYDIVAATVTWNMSANVEMVMFTGSANASSIGNSLHNVMYGNTGDNTLSGGSGHDTINGGDGNDSIDGGTESDLVEGGAGSDTLLGGQRWDTLNGGDGDDVLDGGTENDRMSGGTGNDTYYIDHIGDRAIEVAGEGIDIAYTSIDWAMATEVENLILTGTALAGTGNGLSNRITGNAGANLLSGGNGNDTLTGGQGDDSLTGGTGRDDFVFSLGTLNGADRITDFIHGIDRLVFSGADYGFAAGHRLTAAQFTAGSMAVGPGAQFVWDAATGHLYWDADGNGAGAAVDLAGFDGAPGLTRDDLFFI
ncbi:MULTISPECIES: calcium-binding protein [Asticcacaulis]|uniref:beta strand repeat-containing protein n=1 Tax=Asticcacaulis TaxID=76890 RepID=UPI001AE9F81B|nr:MULTISPECIES: calcium-binding protein [Asticcacaulis]MBP2160407.1 Ca2+-binding RTX toxin-like protein [Asticcacaulis solisilvae]MDR6801290.1 Ca2+-binding RTX toxin-like protein [Asticcacaulis sp. BE141]